MPSAFPRSDTGNSVHLRFGVRGRALGYGQNVKRQADLVREFFALLAPGFVQDGELPDVKVEGVEERHDGHAIASVRAGDRILPVRFTFDEGKIARVEVL